MYKYFKMISSTPFTVILSGASNTHDSVCNQYTKSCSQYESLGCVSDLIGPYEGHMTNNKEAIVLLVFGNLIQAADLVKFHTAYQRCWGMGVGDGTEE